MAGIGSVTPLEVSRPSDIVRESALVSLPTMQGGKTIVVRVQAVPVVDLLAALDGIPGANAAPSPSAVKTFAEIRADIIKADGPSRAVAALGLIEPDFAFDQREGGKAFWGDLLPANQAAVIEAIMTASGMDGGAAKQAAGFSGGAGVEGQEVGGSAPNGA